MAYKMRVQKLGEEKVSVMEASGKISTIIAELGKLGFHVINYIEMDDKDQVVVTKY